MKKKTSFSDFLNEVQPLEKEASGKMTGGFAPFGGDNTKQATPETSIMNGVLVSVLGSACACSCQCSC